MPPHPEWAPLSRALLLAEMPQLQLTLVIGQDAPAHHLPEHPGSLTEAVYNWRSFQRPAQTQPLV